MAIWHFIKNGEGFAWDDGGETVSCFDDGLDYMPGEDGFSRDAADAKAKAMGATAELSGVPGWHARIDRESKAEQEQRDKEAKAEAGAAEKRRADAEAEAAAKAERDASDAATAQAEEEARRAKEAEEADAARAAEQAELEAQQAAAREAAAKDRIFQLTDPEGHAEHHRQLAVQAHYEELAPFASKADQKKIAKALGIAA